MASIGFKLFGKQHVKYDSTSGQMMTCCCSRATMVSGGPVSLSTPSITHKHPGNGNRVGLIDRCAAGLLPCDRIMSDLQDFVFLFVYLPFIISLHFSMHFLNSICKVKERSTSKWYVNVRKTEPAVVDGTLAWGSGAQIRFSPLRTWASPPPSASAVGPPALLAPQLYLRININ